MSPGPTPLRPTRAPSDACPGSRRLSPPRSAVRACQDALGRSEEEEGAGAGGLAFDVKPSELAATRRMASEITERGAKLHDLLVQEDEVGAVRTRALRFLDSLSTDSRGEQEALERALRGALASAQDSVAQLARRAAELDEDEQALGAKIGKKQAELDRNQKRLESLQSVRWVWGVGRACWTGRLGCPPSPARPPACRS